jgi:hypothetical protein
MNKFILVAMNRKNHTQEELDANLDAAAAVVLVVPAYAYAAYAADAAATDAAADAAEYWINKYFERTGEDKQLYINEIERINNMKTVMGASMVGKPSQPVFTQAMADNGELPLVGSEFMHQGKVVKTLSTSKEEGGVVTFLDGTGIGCCWNNDAWVNAIDTRIDKEKAADEFVKDMTDSDFIKEQFKKTFLAGAEWAGE